ncbi:MAG: SUMF1/EgtB/PvdO family nonheme iron enzyme [Bacteroidales bacterium]
MKRILLITLSILQSIILFGQADIKEINASLTKINEKLYASRFEVSNKLYRTFLSSLKQANDNALLSIAQIDTLKWRDKLSYNEPYVQFYHNHPAYSNYPVVNVSHEGARLFCAWLTEQYNTNPKRKFKKVLFRLPTEQEWITAARGGDSLAIYPWQGKDLTDKSGKQRCNYKRETGGNSGMEGQQYDHADITAPVNSYWKNNFGIFNMSGNVAEMIDEKGIAKGGSWNENKEYLKIDAQYRYDGSAQTSVGFRYFAEIIEK